MASRRARWETILKTALSRYHSSTVKTEARRIANYSKRGKLPATEKDDKWTEEYHGRLEGIAVCLQYVEGMADAVERELSGATTGRSKKAANDVAVITPLPMLIDHFTDDFPVWNPFSGSWAVKETGFEPGPSTRVYHPVNTTSNSTAHTGILVRDTLPGESSKVKLQEASPNPPNTMSETQAALMFSDLPFDTPTTPKRRRNGKSREKSPMKSQCFISEPDLDLLDTFVARSPTGSDISSDIAIERFLTPSSSPVSVIAEEEEDFTETDRQLVDLLSSGYSTDEESRNLALKLAEGYDQDFGQFLEVDTASWNEALRLQKEFDTAAGLPPREYSAYPETLQQAIDKQLRQERKDAPITPPARTERGDVPVTPHTMIYEQGSNPPLSPSRREASQPDLLGADRPYTENGHANWEDFSRKRQPGMQSVCTVQRQVETNDKKWNEEQDYMIAVLGLQETLEVEGQEEAERIIREQQALQEREDRRQAEVTKRTLARMRTCGVCGDKFDMDEMVQPCEHIYCQGCLAEAIKTSFASRQVFKCCNRVVHPTFLTDHLPTTFCNKWSLLHLELTTPNPLFCHSKTCSTFIPPTSIHGDIGTCNACKKRTCRHCRNASHEGTFCVEDRETTKVKELGKKNGWKNCPGCGHLIERNQGCLHMTCRVCKTEFCYNCVKWPCSGGCQR